MINKNVSNIIKIAGKVVNIITPMIKLRNQLISLGYSISDFDHDQPYKIGAVVDIDNIIAVVVEAKDGGRHGKVMCLKSSREEWGYKDYANQNTNGRDSLLPLIHYDVSIEQCSNTDGESNCKSIETEIAKWDSDDLHQHTVSFGSKFIEVRDRLAFPAFDYCKKIGVDWYLPAIEELHLAFTNHDIISIIQHITNISTGQTSSIWSSSYDKSKRDYDNYCGSTSYAFGLSLCSGDTISIESFPQSTKAIVFPFRKF